MSVQRLFALTFLVCHVPCAFSCFLGYNIESIQTTKDGQYDISCSQRALPICPKVCTWTNQTCEEYATRRHWDKTHLVVTNMTYSYPLKASGYPRNDTDGGERTKSLHRRCCLADNIEATKCNSAVWNVAQSKGNFDILANAKSDLKCATNNAYLRDIRQQGGGVQRTLTLDMCCMKYPKDHDARVACTAPKNGETQAGVDAAAKIALGVSLPLALGIGIPLLLLSCETRAQRFVGVTASCTTRTLLRGVSEKECCSLCVAQHFPACGYAPAALGQGVEFCVICRSAFGNFVSGDPRYVVFIPK